MTDITRGALITVRATLKDADGEPVTPSSVKLYLNYKHADGAVSTDEPIDMSLDSESDKYVAEFDSAVALPGVLAGSIRTIDPPDAIDFKRKIVANPANPDPEDT